MQYKTKDIFLKRMYEKFLCIELKSLYKIKNIKIFNAKEKKNKIKKKEMLVKCD